LIFLCVFLSNYRIFEDIDFLYNGLINFWIIGNSARVIRMSIICFASSMVLLFIKDYRSIKSTIFLAILSGFSIIWSNDGGIATFISISLLFFILMIKEFKTNIKEIIIRLGIYGIVSLSSFIIICIVVTLGNPMSYINQTLAASQFQKWYYGDIISKSNTSISEIDLSFDSILLFIILLFNIYRMLKEKDNKKSILYFSLNIMILSSIISAYLYQIISGGISKDFLDIVLIICIFGYFIRIVLFIWKKCIERFLIDRKEIIGLLIKTVVVIYVFLFILLFIVQTSNIKQITQRDIYYIEELDGFFPEYHKSIRIALDRTKDKKVFSTYASALEVAKGQFQPTGSDYIIHVLGDENRENYINTFLNSDFDYVCTVDRDFNAFREWCISANWWFYRLLYRDYKPSFVTDYNVFFEKDESKEKNNQEYEFSCNKNEDYEYEITVKTNNNYCGIADIKICYSSYFLKSFFETGVYNRYVCVEDLSAQKIRSKIDEEKNAIIDYCLPLNSDEYYIPVRIINGEGKIKISSYPYYETGIEIKSIEVIDILDADYKYCDAFGGDENRLYVKNTNLNQMILNNAKSIKMNDNTANIIEIQIKNDDIILYLDSDATCFKYPDVFEVIKGE
jgi:hypothetical protein